MMSRSILSISNFNVALPAGGGDGWVMGWIEPNSGIDITDNLSYAPPSVSNLEMPSTNTPTWQSP